MTARCRTFRDSNERGVRFYRAGRYGRAVGELKQAVRLARIPLPALRINLGAAYLRTGRFEKARGALVDGLALDPDDRAGHWLLGQVLEAQGEFLDARDEFAIAAGLDPDSPEGRSAEDAIARLSAARRSARR